MLGEHRTRSPLGTNKFLRALAATFLAFACLPSLTLDLPTVAAARTPATSISLPLSADKKPKQSPVLKSLPITELTEDEAILHALNRLGYGPRPGEIDRVRQMGLAKWIEQQLDPNSIEDPAVEARLENYPTLAMSSSRLLAEYPQPKQAAKQAGLTKEEFRQQQAEKRRADAAAETVAMNMQRGKASRTITSRHRAKASLRKR